MPVAYARAVLRSAPWPSRPPSPALRAPAAGRRADGASAAAQAPRRAAQPPAPDRRRRRRRSAGDHLRPDRPGAGRLPPAGSAPVVYRSHALLREAGRQPGRRGEDLPVLHRSCEGSQPSVAERVGAVRRRDRADRRSPTSSGCGRRTSSTTSSSRCATCATRTASSARSSSTTWRSASASRSSTTSARRRSSSRRSKKS